MATKTKPVITAEAVTSNLQRLFPGKYIRCTEVVENWNDTPTFYIETNMMKVAVVGKQVLEKPSIKRWADYIIWCNDGNSAYKKTQTKLGTCIPFVYRKGRWANKQNNTDADLILIACGLKKAPVVANPLDPITRLKEIDSSYVEVYKIFQKENIISADFQYGTMRHHQKYWVESQPQWMCRVQTETGSYRFSVEVPHHTEEIKAIFANLLGISLAIRVKEKDLVAA